MRSEILKGSYMNGFYVVPNAVVNASGGLWGETAYKILKESAKYGNKVTFIDSKRKLRARTNNLVDLLKLEAIPGTKLTIEVEESPSHSSNVENIAQRFYELISAEKDSNLSGRV